MADEANTVAKHNRARGATIVRGRNIERLPTAKSGGLEERLKSTRARRVKPVERVGRTISESLGRSSRNPIPFVPCAARALVFALGFLGISNRPALPASKTQSAPN